MHGSGLVPGPLEIEAVFVVFRLPFVGVLVLKYGLIIIAELFELLAALEGA
jgi:hypothetical protein